MCPLQQYSKLPQHQIQNTRNKITCFVCNTCIFIPSNLFFCLVCGKDNSAASSVKILLPLFDSFSPCSFPCFPTSLPELRLQRWYEIRQINLRAGKNAVITKAACFHLHIPHKVVTIPFWPSCGIYVSAQARCCFGRYHERIWTKGLESFLGA